MADFILLIFESLNVTFDRKFVPVGELPDSLSTLCCLKFHIAEDFLVAFAASFARAIGRDSPGAGKTGDHQLGGEVFTVGSFDEGVEPLMPSIAKCALHPGVNGKGGLQQLGSIISSLFAEVLGKVDGVRCVPFHVGNSKVAPLIAEPPGVRVVADVPLKTVGRIDADCHQGSIGLADLETVAIRPVSADEGASLNGFKELGLGICHRQERCKNGDEGAQTNHAVECCQEASKVNHKQSVGAVARGGGLKPVLGAVPGEVLRCWPEPGVVVEAHQNRCQANLFDIGEQPRFILGMCAHCSSLK